MVRARTSGIRSGKPIGWAPDRWRDGTGDPRTSPWAVRAFAALPPPVVLASRRCESLTPCVASFRRCLHHAECPASITWLSIADAKRLGIEVSPLDSAASVPAQTPARTPPVSPAAIPSQLWQVP